MEASSSSGLFFGIREDSQSQPTSDMGPAPPPQQPPQKKRRNQPGTPSKYPNPDAEVIALSPNSLMATNRFICEVCNKGFQREQNLQLHRRGHNLPWKLRQKTTKEVKKKVYLCPEPTCVHHDPSRPLGDLTGIKKHYSRKHGEKKWKCDKCSKWYAVQSDWKAHSKTCGTREYRCDCGTLFSRRDSFVTHRAFCEALSLENARRTLDSIGHHLNGSATMRLGLSRVGDQVSSLQDQNNTSGAAGSTQFDHFLLPSMGSVSSGAFFLREPNQEHQLPVPHQISSAPSFFNPTPSGLLTTEHFSSNIMGDQITSNISPLFAQNNNMVPQMSATALLQRAAQIGSTSSNNNNNNSSSASLTYSFGHGQGKHQQQQQQQQQSLNVSVGVSDGLTRDFLGVGQIVRSLSRGGEQQHHQQQQGITAPTGHHSFGGDGGFQ
ncbi:hypothetical protein V6N13_055386 [Hibiscus sabdariffa]|uniref:C2H2-type domain-containing protein n=2 Tax=Hibiscus sabdariffa TaxID=183260 RepID=A0ABR2BL96_9ROSI